ncbi:MAG: hydantoinase/oxoprolinase family protein [Aureliella sp.]
MPEIERRDELCVGLDVGGANLKLASTDGYCEHAGFPLWKHPQKLQSAIESMLGRCVAASAREPSAIGLTMTGELADCYETRSIGVVAICESVAAACPIPPLVYGTDGRWLTISEAMQSPLSVAASNWHALSSWIAADLLPDVDHAVVVDIGSTTTDVIAIAGGRVMSTSRTDRERLLSGELVYTGMRRTPVVAILPSVSLGGVVCPVMAEAFATSDDAYILLGLVGESLGDTDTADGRPRSQAAAGQRLARMVGEDFETLGDATQQLAHQVIEAQATVIADAVERVAARLPNSNSVKVVLSGEGQQLFQFCERRFSRQVERVDLTEVIGTAAAQVAPAMAVSHLIWRQHATA